jgi:hypothetical protein
MHCSPPRAGFLYDAGNCGHHGFDGGDWAQCYSEAAKICPSGYTIHDKSQEAGPVFAISGAKRTLLGACKA